MPHADGRERVFAAENQQCRAADAGQQRAHVGVFDGGERVCHALRRAVAQYVGQHGFDNGLAFGRVQQLQFQKLAHVLGVIVLKQRQHFVQRGLAQADVVIRRGEEFGEGGAQCEAFHFFGIMRGNPLRHHAAQRPAEQVGVRPQLPGNIVRQRGDIE